MGFWAQLTGKSPFGGTMSLGRVPLFGFGRPTLPFPHPWNFHQPLRILETYFHRADEVSGSARHTRYLSILGLAPFLVTREPRLIRAISAITSDQPGHFDRDTLPSAGIARATGEDTLLYSNGASWKHQKKLATPPFARTTLFQPERFHEFEALFRRTVGERLALVRQRVGQTGTAIEVELEPEIKALMLEMLVNCFFGADVPYDQIRDRYVPALERVIDHIVSDTVWTRAGIPLHRLPAWTESLQRNRDARQIFEELTDRVLAARAGCAGLWGQFKSDASDDALRGNIRVFLAGALEATTSYASWAISHLARRTDLQTRLHEEIAEINDFTPQTLAGAKFLNAVLDETLRLTPSLYFHPRRATQETTIEIGSGQSIVIPKGTHILLDVWHANRHEDHWGIQKTGFRAEEFHPERWEKLAEQDRGDFLHFGFGHGPRFCPGKNLGQMEVALVVGACVKLFEFSASGPEVMAKAGVSTKPLDGVRVKLRPRSMGSEGFAATGLASGPVRASTARCPFGFGQSGQ